MRNITTTISALIAISLIALTANTHALEPFKVSKIISVYDGDTFRVNIDGIHPLIGDNIGIRVNNVDTPEIKGKCPSEKKLAIKARDFVASRLKSAKEVLLVNPKRGKYFRIVADVMIDGQMLDKMLFEKGLAYQYDGGRKKSWCK